MALAISPSRIVKWIKEDMLSKLDNSSDWRNSTMSLGSSASISVGVIDAGRPWSTLMRLNPRNVSRGLRGVGREEKLLAVRRCMQSTKVDS